MNSTPSRQIQTYVNFNISMKKSNLFNRTLVKDFQQKNQMRSLSLFDLANKSLQKISIQDRRPFFNNISNIFQFRNNVKADSVKQPSYDEPENQLFRNQLEIQFQNLLSGSKNKIRPTLPLFQISKTMVFNQNRMNFFLQRKQIRQIFNFTYSSLKKIDFRNPSKGFKEKRDVLNNCFKKLNSYITAQCKQRGQLLKLIFIEYETTFIQMTLLCLLTFKQVSRQYQLQAVSTHQLYSNQINNMKIQIEQLVQNKNEINKFLNFLTEQGRTLRNRNKKLIKMLKQLERQKQFLKQQIKFFHQNHNQLQSEGNKQKTIVGILNNPKDDQFSKIMKQLKKEIKVQKTIPVQQLLKEYINKNTNMLEQQDYQFEQIKSYKQMGVNTIQPSWPQESVQVDLKVKSGNKMIQTQSHHQTIIPKRQQELLFKSKQIQILNAMLIDKEKQIQIHKSKAQQIKQKHKICDRDLRNLKVKFNKIQIQLIRFKEKRDKDENLRFQEEMAQYLNQGGNLTLPENTLQQKSFPTQPKQFQSSVKIKMQNFESDKKTKLKAMHANSRSKQQHSLSSNKGNKQSKDRQPKRLQSKQFKDSQIIRQKQPKIIRQQKQKNQASFKNQDKKILEKSRIQQKRKKNQEKAAMSKEKVQIQNEKQNRKDKQKQKQRQKQRQKQKQKQKQKNSNSIKGKLGNSSMKSVQKGDKAKLQSKSKQIQKRKIIKSINLKSSQNKYQPQTQQKKGNLFFNQGQSNLHSEEQNQIQEQYIKYMESNQNLQQESPQPSQVKFNVNRSLKRLQIQILQKKECTTYQSHFKKNSRSDKHSQTFIQTSDFTQMTNLNKKNKRKNLKICVIHNFSALYQNQQNAKKIKKNQVQINQLLKKLGSNQKFQQKKGDTLWLQEQTLIYLNKQISNLMKQRKKQVQQVINSYKNIFQKKFDNQELQNIARNVVRKRSFYKQTRPRKRANSLTKVQQQELNILQLLKVVGNYRRINQPKQNFKEDLKQCQYLDKIMKTYKKLNKNQNYYAFQNEIFAKAFAINQSSVVLTNKRFYVNLLANIMTQVHKFMQKHRQKGKLANYFQIICKNYSIAPLHVLLHRKLRIMYANEQIAQKKYRETIYFIKNSKFQQIQIIREIMMRDFQNQNSVSFLMLTYLCNLLDQSKYLFQVDKMFTSFKKMKRCLLTILQFNFRSDNQNNQKQFEWPLQQRQNISTVILSSKIIKDYFYSRILYKKTIKQIWYSVVGNQTDMLQFQVWKMIIMVLQISPLKSIKFEKVFSILAEFSLKKQLFIKKFSFDFLITYAMSTSQAQKFLNYERMLKKLNFASVQNMPEQLNFIRKICKENSLVGCLTLVDRLQNNINKDVTHFKLQSRITYKVIRIYLIQLRIRNQIKNFIGEFDCIQNLVSNLQENSQDRQQIRKKYPQVYFNERS